MRCSPVSFTVLARVPNDVSRDCFTDQVVEVTESPAAGLDDAQELVASVSAVALAVTDGEFEEGLRDGCCLGLPGSQGDALKPMKVLTFF